MKALVLAAGHGKRLGLEDRNKVMLELKDGRPVIAHIVDYLLRYEMEPVIAVARSTFGDGIIDYFRKDKRITFSIADEPTGTAGDIYHARPMLEGDFLVHFGDTLADIDLTAMLKQHKTEGNAVTLCGIDRAMVPYGIISMHNGVRLEEKPDFNFGKHGFYVNCPVFYTNSRIFGHMGGMNDFFGDVVPKIREVGCYVHRGFYYDIGTKKSYEEVRRLDIRV